MLSTPTEFLFGIYGYEFHLPSDLGEIELIPLHDPQRVAALAADESRFQLTGYGRFTSPVHDRQAVERLYVLEAALTFIEHRHVFVTPPISMSAGDTLEALLGPDRLGAPIAGLTRRTSGGAAILEEKWSAGSRSTFLRLATSRFAFDDPTDVLRRAFFRHVEIWRLSTRFVELHHFLAFSALEMLARASGSYDSQNNAAVPISEFLTAQGFPATQSEIERWTEARNNAFHRGLLSAPARSGQGVVGVSDQLYPMTTVLGDALLKLLRFDDGHINWNRWRDRMAFC